MKILKGGYTQKKDFITWHFLMYPHVQHKYTDEPFLCHDFRSSISYFFHPRGRQTLKQKILHDFYPNHLRATVKSECSQTINSE